MPPGSSGRVLGVYIGAGGRVTTADLARRRIAGGGGSLRGGCGHLLRSRHPEPVFRTAAPSNSATWTNQTLPTSGMLRSAARPAAPKWHHAGPAECQEPGPGRLSPRRRTSSGEWLAGRVDWQSKDELVPPNRKKITVLRLSSWISTATANRILPWPTTRKY